ncbi:MAG: non-hydrolyzing UDP-N-acetylglucosamine 2-epimerase [Phycisphaerales bacterium JB063]
MPHTVAVFMGTRPEAIKLAPVVRALRDHAELTPVLVSTGQHKEMLAQIAELFDVHADLTLDAMRPGQSLTALHARLLTQIDGTLDTLRPDYALVQGDTTTVLAAAQACFYRRVAIGHVEAGLRTGDLNAPFPEEANRRQASVLCDLHFAPTTQARDNLLAEGVDARTIHVTGNTVIDALHLEAERQQHEAIAQQTAAALADDLGEGWNDKPYVLVTGHRRENFGEGMRQICAALRELALRFPERRFIYPVHLNPNVAGPVHEQLAGVDNLLLTGPKDYRLFVALLRGCEVVLTDSGGVQEEAPSLGKPVLVMRETTERPEGVAAGAVALVGADRGRIVAGVAHLLENADARAGMSGVQNPYGDGRASQRIAEAIHQRLRA